MKKGFTLIELLIVIAIIGILAVAFLPSLLGAPSRARDTTRMAQINKIQSLLMPMAVVNKLPPTRRCIINPPGAPSTPATIGDVIKAAIADFGGVFPADPKPIGVLIGTDPECNGGYGYLKYLSGKVYSAGVFAVVENADKANILCSNISQATTPVLTPGKVVGINPSLGKYGCYFALIK